jgi:hypothetical protein
MAMIDWRRRSKESTQYLVEDYVSGHIVQCGDFLGSCEPEPIEYKKLPKIQCQYFWRLGRRRVGRQRKKIFVGGAATNQW